MNKLYPNILNSSANEQYIFLQQVIKYCKENEIDYFDQLIFKKN